MLDNTISPSPNMERGSGGEVGIGVSPYMARLSPVQLRLPLDFFRPALFICAPSNPSPEMLAYARYLVGWLWKNHNHWRIIAGDGYGVDAEIVRAAHHWGIPVSVSGHTSRPHNGVSLRDYTRLPYPDPARRDRALVAQADKVICLWDGATPGIKTVYDYARKFKQKKVSIKTFPRLAYSH